MTSDTMPPNAAISIIDGLSAIIDQYDIFLLDQWGVIHNGVTLHDGAAEAILRLNDAGKTIIILSNSGKRAGDSYQRLAGFGIGRDQYLDIVTSGELVYRNLKERTDPFYQSLGPKCLIFAWDDDRNVIKDTGVEEVGDIDDADFVLCVGTDQQDIEAYKPSLEVAQSRGLPMVCGNPDRVSVQPDGSLKLCPGAVAELYEAMGGTVRWHGKPAREVYQTCLAMVDQPGAAIGVGDSLIHDIKGASDSGLASLLISGGIHYQELDLPLSANAVSSLGDRYGAQPTYACPEFRW